MSIRIGSVCYVPPHGKLNSEAFIRNITRYKCANDLFLFSDDPKWKLSKTIGNPETMLRRTKFSINNFLFFASVVMAREAGLEWFIYLEADSRVGCHNWDDRMFNEFYSRYGWDKAACAGSPVMFDINAGGKEFAKACVDMAFQYQKASGMPAAIYGNKHPFDTSGSALYPNGSVAIYSVAMLYKLFPDIVQNTVQMSERIGPWDTEIARRLWMHYGADVINKVGWLACSYSGYGNAVVDEQERVAMLRRGEKTVCHQIKSAIEV